MEQLHYRSKENWDSLKEDSKLFEHLCTKVLPQHLYKCRWFGGKANKLVSCTVDDIFHLHDDFRHYYFLVLEVFFKESFAQHYFLPLAISEDHDQPESAYLSKVTFGAESFALIDAVYDPGFHHCLFRKLQENAHLTNGSETIFRSQLPLESDENFRSKLLSAEQSNSTIVINDEYYLKIFRRLFRDKNPDFEINEFLSNQQVFTNTPQLAGLISWKVNSGFEISLGLMQQKVENQGDAWNWLLAELDLYFSKAKADGNYRTGKTLLKATPIKKLAEHFLEQPGEEFFYRIETLARRTAEMHLALAHERRDRAFVPVHYNSDFTVWLKNRLIFQFEARYNLLQKKLHTLPPEAKAMAIEIMEAKDEIINFILDFDEENLRSARIRIHGDYHLGQILIQDDDFFILDFEGEPESTIRDRKVKQSPLKDVAGLFRSFHYAIFATLFKDEAKLPGPERLQQSKALYKAMVGVFLDTYFKIAFDQNLDIGYRKEIRYLLHYFILEKAIYELGYELNGRPDWAIIPLRGITEIIQEIKEYAN